MASQQPWSPQPIGSPVPAGASASRQSTKTFAAQHRTQLLAAGGAGVVLIALVRSRSKSAAATAAAAAAAAGTTTAATTVTAANGGSGVYSSAVTDFYDAIQPTLEQIQSQIDKLNNAPTVTTPAVAATPVPVAATPLPAAPAPAPAPVAAALQRYVVQPGDNLSAIAQRFNLPGGNSTGWHALYAANTGVIGGNPNLIHPGQTLVIPAH